MLSPVRVKSLLICALVLASCQFTRVNQDAAAAAKQLASTSADLAAYYGALSQIAANEVALNELQSATLEIPFEKADRDRFTRLSSELDQRAELAAALQGLSTAFSNLSGSSDPAKVSTAASRLAAKLSSISSLPGAAGAISLSPLFADAAKLLVTAIQTRQERKAAQSMKATLDALHEQFSKEMAVYESLNKTYFALAKSLAKYLVDRNMVDETVALAPALRPFGLTGRVIDEKILRKLVRDQIDAKSDDAIREHSAASKAMNDSMAEMAKRVTQLADEKRCDCAAKGEPTTLSTVEKWVTRAGAYFPPPSSED